MHRWSTLAALWLLVLGSLVVASQIVTWLAFRAVSQELTAVGGGMVLSAWAVVRTWAPTAEQPPPEQLSPGTGGSPPSSSPPSQ